MNDKCDIARDMMPLCADGTASEATRSCVEQHVSACEACRTVYAEMQSHVDLAIPQQNPEFAKAVRAMKTRRKRRTWLAVLLGALLTLAAVFFCLCAYRAYYVTPEAVTAGRITFHQTPEAQGLSLMHLHEIPAGAQVRVHVISTDRDADGVNQYEAYVSVWATRAQQRGKIGSAYYILGSAKEGKIYMNHSGQPPVAISQVISGTAAGGGQVVYLPEFPMAEVALFGLTVKGPDHVTWDVSQPTAFPIAE